MTPEGRARHKLRPESDVGYRLRVHVASSLIEDLEQTIADAIRRAVEEEREACARIAEGQEYFHDTHTGTRQEWVKVQIATKIRARGS